MHLKLLTTLFLLVAVTAKPQIRTRFTSQTPNDLSKSLELSQNPFLANQNGDLYKYLLENRVKSVTTTPLPNMQKLTVEELLQNPYFVMFYNEFTKQQESGNNPITQTPTYVTNPPTTTLSPPRLPFNNPFFSTTTSSTPSPPRTQNFISAPFFPSKNSTPQQTRTRMSSRPSQTVPTTEATSQFLRMQPAIRQPQLPSLREEAAIPINIQPTFEVLEPAPIAPTHTKIASRVSGQKTVGDQSKYEAEVFKKQAESAKYMFASNINDNINDNFNHREEVRDGLSVKGAYSYSDGFFNRTVHYEADEKGYRVVSEEVEPIGNGPLYNPNGHADVSSDIDGQTNQYEITKEDIKEKRQLSEAIPANETIDDLIE